MSEQWYCPNCGPTGEPYGHHGGVSADCPRCGEEQRKAPAFVTKMQEQIAILETSLAERWESLNVQDGIIDGLQEEIAALRESLGLLKIGHDHKATLLASCEIALGERDEKISTLQSDLAAAREEIARAKPALIKAWEIFFTRSFSQDPIGRAEARYAREISQAHRGEEG